MPKLRCARYPRLRRASGRRWARSVAGTLVRGWFWAAAHSGEGQAQAQVGRHDIVEVKDSVYGAWTKAAEWPRMQSSDLITIKPTLLDSLGLVLPSRPAHNAAAKSYGAGSAGCGRKVKDTAEGASGAGVRRRGSPRSSRLILSLLPERGALIRARLSGEQHSQ